MTFISAFLLVIQNFMAPTLVVWTLVQWLATNTSPKGLALVVGVFLLD
jgi:hypothetical protein